MAVPLTGWLVTRYGSKRVMMWSTVGFSLALIMPGLAINAATLFGSLSVFGAMAGANDVSINSQAVSMEAALGEPTMSRFHAMFSVGGMIGASLGGLVAAREVPPSLHLVIASAFFLLIAVFTAPLLLDANDNIQARDLAVLR